MFVGRFASDDGRTDMMRRTASYASRCRACGTSYGVGSQIFSAGAGWFCSPQCAEAGPLRVSAADVAARAGASPFGRGWRARCPVHESRGLTLSIAEGDDGGVVMQCFRGCDTSSIVAALGIEMYNLAPRDSSTLRVLLGRREPATEDEIRDALRDEAEAYRSRHRLNDGERLVHADIAAVRHTVAVRLGVSLPPVARRAADSACAGRERDPTWPALLDRAWRIAHVERYGWVPAATIDEAARGEPIVPAEVWARVERIAADDLRSLACAAPMRNTARRVA